MTEKRIAKARATSLPSGWALAEFHDLAESLSDHGRKLAHKDYLKRGKYPVVDQGEDEIGGFCNDDSLLFAGMLPVILFGDHTRRFKFIDQPFIVGADGVKLISAAPITYPKYLLYAFRNLKFEDRGYSRHFQFVRKAQLPLAPLQEQKHIVDAIESYLSRLDVASSSLEQAQEKLNAYRASVLKAAVDGRLVPTEAELARCEQGDYERADVLLERILTERRKRWELTEFARLSAAGKRPKDDKWKANYEEPGSAKPDELPPLPDGWSWATIEQVSYVSGGVTKNAARDNHPLTVPYLRVANVYANSLDLSEIKEIGVTNTELPHVLLQRGDLLIVEGNGSIDQIGRVALWDGTVSPVVHQNHLIKARFAEPGIEKWTLIWLLSPGGRAIIQRVASSTSGLHTLSISKVESLPVPIPPVFERERIVEEVEKLSTVIDTQVREVNESMRRVSRLRQSILKWAFEGKLVDQDPNDEPAEKLLERIRTERAAKEPVKKTAQRRKAKAAE